MPAPQPILDSHVHLLPAHALTPAQHPWLRANHPLARAQSGLAEYAAASSACSPTRTRDSTNSGPGWAVRGIVYIETDRTLGEEPPAWRQGRVGVGSKDGNGGDEDEWAGRRDELAAYWFEKIAELRDLSATVSGPGGDVLRAAVVWAPVHMGAGAVQEYARVAEKASRNAWRLVKGVRFLIQEFREEAYMRRLVLGERWMAGLREVFRRGWAFDVGIDIRSGGFWQVEVVAEMVEEYERRYDAEGETPVWILNHLCKPDLKVRLRDRREKVESDRCTLALQRLARHPRVYVKLSGCLSEVPEGEQWPKRDIVSAVARWKSVFWDLFGARRIMFGSDWPICEIRGPTQESWRLWRDVVENVLEVSATEHEKEWVWWRTAAEAYKIEMEGMAGTKPFNRDRSADDEA